MRARLFGTLLMLTTPPLAVGAAPLLRGKHAIANQYIVQIKPDQVRAAGDISAAVRSRPSVAEFADHQTKTRGAQVQRVFEHAIKDKTTRKTPSQAEALASDPAVLLVEEDQIIT